MTEVVPGGLAFTKGMHSVFRHMRAGCWSVTPYVLCDHRCTYCCTFVQGQSDPLLSPEEAVEEFHRIRRSGEPMGLLLLGALSDAYPSAEAEHGITRALLREFAASGIQFTIVTKGTTVLRDVDLLRSSVGPANVQVSICCTDDEVVAAIDPGAPSATRRFELIHELRDAGVAVELNALPWIPGITDTGELIARVPDDVPITLGPLSIGVWGPTKRILGHDYSRAEVWPAYLEEYLEFGHVPNTSWVVPSLTPNENDPFRRLPCPPDPSHPAFAAARTVGDLDVSIRR